MFYIGGGGGGAARCPTENEGKNIPGVPNLRYVLATHEYPVCLLGPLNLV